MSNVKTTFNNCQSNNYPKVEETSRKIQRETCQKKYLETSKEKQQLVELDAMCKLEDQEEEEEEGVKKSTAMTRQEGGSLRALRKRGRRERKMRAEWMDCKSQSSVQSCKK